MTQDDNATYLERTNGGTTFIGSDQNIFAALHLASALRIFAKTGLLPTRGVTATMMLKSAQTYTGKTFKRGQYIEAADALTTYADNLKSQPRTQ